MGDRSLYIADGNGKQKKATGTSNCDMMCYLSSHKQMLANIDKHQIYNKLEMNYGGPWILKYNILPSVLLSLKKRHTYIST